MKHWKKRMFAAAALAAALPIARGQSAPAAAAGAWSTDSTSVAADHAYLGVYPGSQAEGGGVKLEQVVDGSPAAKAGLQAGDVITTLGDRTVGSDDELRTAIASHASGEKVKITFLRDGEKRRTSARLGKSPSENEGGGGETTTEPAAEKSAQGAATASPKGGRGMVELTPAPEGGEDSGYLGVMLASAEDGRTTVSQVVDGSPAQKAGIQNGDVILKIDGEEAGSQDAWVELVKKHHAGDKVTVTVEREGKSQKLKVKLGSRSAANLGGGAGGMAAPTIVPPVEAKPADPAATTRAARSARARTEKAATGEAAGGDSMRKEVDGMRSELEHLRRSMEELKRKCESQQRTIEKIRRALDGNEEPGSLSFAADGAAVGGDAAVTMALPSELATAAAPVAMPDGGSIAFAAPVAAGGEAGEAGEGGTECCATAGTATACADGAKAECCATDGDGTISIRELPLVLNVGDGDQKIELEGLGEKIRAIVKQHHGDGKVIRVKPQVSGQAVELVVDGDEGECCATGAGDDGAKSIVVKTKAGKDFKVFHAGDGTGVFSIQAPKVRGGMAGKAIVVPAGTGNGVKVFGGKTAASGSCCSCCGECCNENEEHHSTVIARHPGMGLGGGMPGMHGTGTFEVLPGMPGMGGAGPDAPRRARVRAMKIPGMPGAPMNVQPMKMPRFQTFPRMNGGGTTVWKCDGPCELIFGGDGGAQFRFEGSCEISQSGVGEDVTGAFTTDSDDGDEDEGDENGEETATFSFEGMDDGDDDATFEVDCDGADCGSEDADHDHEDGDDDDDSGNDDGDEDDDDDDDASVPSSIALPAI